MMLVDSSVWIEFFRRPSDLDLEAVLDLDEMVRSLPIVQEVLQRLDGQSAYRTASQACWRFRSSSQR